MAFAILASGLGYSNAEIFCDFNDFPIFKESSFYDYLHLMEPILEKIADQVCKDKLLEAQLKEQFVVGFDGGWSHRRNANQCIGILIDLLTGYIISFQIIHHGIENSLRVTSTDKNSKTMEKDALELILNEIDSLDLGKFKFVHDCDIQADLLVMKKCECPNFI